MKPKKRNKRIGVYVPVVKPEFDHRDVVSGLDYLTDIGLLRELFIQARLGFEHLQKCSGLAGESGMKAEAEAKESYNRIAYRIREELARLRKDETDES